MEGVLELAVNVLVMGALVVYVLAMDALVLVVDCLVVRGALIVDVLIEQGVLALVADALHVGGDALVVDAVVVSLQTLELGELVEEV